MDARDFTYFLRDSAYGEGDAIDNWLSFQIILKFNRVGTWNLEVPKDSVVARSLSKRSGIIVKYKGHTIFSGFITTDWVETKNTLSVSGKDDNWLLDTPCRPTPSYIVGPYPDEFDVTTGVASTILRSLVNRNIGPAAVGNWKIPQLAIDTDPLVGDVITARARFDTLNVLLAELASTPTALGMGFRILQSDSVPGQVLFSLYFPRDLHDTVVFSTDIGTAEDFTYTFSYPEANYFFVAGGDAYGQDRTVIEGGDAASITALGRLVAKFVDKRGVTDTGELNQELDEQIATAVTSEKIEITPVDTNAIEFYDDYFLGDYVSAVVNGVQLPRIVREIEIDFDPLRGPLIKPLLADPYGSNDLETTRQFASLNARVLGLEQIYNVPDGSITEAMLHPFMKWHVGDIKMTALAASQSGWLLCNGSSLLRSAYPELFIVIGTLYGPGASPGTTFALPNLRDRFPIGAGLTNALGLGVDVTTLSFDHVHTHSHGLNHHKHLEPHAHPHSHGSGTLDIKHTHTVDIDHTHGTILSGFAQYSTDITAVNPTAGATTVGHKHNVNVVALGTTNKTTSTSSNPTSRTGSTDSDNNAAVYGSFTGAPDPNSSEPDASHPDSLTAAYTLPSRSAVNFCIYVGRF